MGTTVASSYIAYVRTPLWKAALLSYRLPQGMIVTTVASSYIAYVRTPLWKAALLSYRLPQAFACRLKRQTLSPLQGLRAI